MRILKGTFSIFVKFLPLAITGLLLGVIAQLSGIFMPKLMGMIVDYGLGDTVADNGVFNPFLFLLKGLENNTIRMLTILCVAFMTLLIIKHITLYSRNNINQYNGMMFNKVLRVNAVRKYWAYTKTIPTGIIYTTLNNDTINIKEMYIAVIPLLVDNFIIILVSFIIMATINIQLLIVPLLAIPFIVVAAVIYMKKAGIVTVRSRSCFVDLNYAIEENFSNFDLVKQYGREDYEIAIFRGFNRRFCDSNIKVNRLNTKFTFFFNIIRAVTYVATFAVGTVLAINKVISIGNFMEFLMYIFLILDGINNTITVCFNFQHLVASGNRYMDFMALPIVTSGSGNVTLPSKPNIQISNLSFLREQTKLLDDISLDIEYGKIIGLTGEGGSGKSLLIKLISGMQVIHSGNILIGGIEIDKAEQYSLYNTFSQVYEEGQIIDGTVKANITYGSKKVDKIFLSKCMEISGLTAQLNELENGLDTVIVNTTDVSVGMLQSINLCRALVYNKDVFLMDEPFKNIPYEMSKKVISDVMTHLKGKTVIMTSLNPECLKYCDEVLCMVDGQVVERGTHKELMANKADYSKIVKRRKIES